MLDQHFTLRYPPLQVRAGVLVADGYGITLRVLYGKLHVEDGIGPHRRRLVVDRAGSGLERLVLLGKTGSLTLEALAGCVRSAPHSYTSARTVRCSRTRFRSVTTVILSTCASARNDDGP